MISLVKLIKSTSYQLETLSITKTLDTPITLELHLDFTELGYHWRIQDIASAFTPYSNIGNFSQSFKLDDFSHTYCSIAYSRIPHSRLNSTFQQTP